MKKSVVLAFVLALGGCVSSEGELDAGEDGEFDTFAVDGSADAFGVAENTPEARAILDFVNARTNTELVAFAQLPTNSASHIYAFRMGPDAKPSTADDRRIASLTALDAINWVGPRTLGALRRYVASRQGVSDAIYNLLHTCQGNAKGEQCELPETSDPLDYADGAFGIVEMAAKKLQLKLDGEFRMVEIRSSYLPGEAYRGASYEFFAPAKGTKGDGYYATLDLGSDSVSFDRGSPPNFQYLPNRIQVANHVGSNFADARDEYQDDHNGNFEVLESLVYFADDHLGDAGFFYVFTKVGGDGEAIAFVHPETLKVIDRPQL